MHAIGEVPARTNKGQAPTGVAPPGISANGRPSGQRSTSALAAAAANTSA
jgi:hypothetical protein